MRFFKYFRAFFVIVTFLLTNITSAKCENIFPNFDCSENETKELTFIEEMYCSSEKIQKIMPEMKQAYNFFYETLSSAEQKNLQESQRNWFNNIKYQSFIERTSYETREFYLTEHIQNRIDLLKDATKDKDAWTGYLRNREKESQKKVRYLEKIEDGYSDVCAEIEKFLVNKPSEIKFAKFEFEQENEDIVGTFERAGLRSTLYFDIDNDGKKEIIERYSSTPSSTFSSQTDQTATYYESEKEQQEKKYKNVGILTTSGAVELFTYRNQNYVFNIPYSTIGNNREITEFYKENHLNNSSMEYLKLALQKDIYEEYTVYNPPHILILQHNNGDTKEVCVFSIKEPT